MDKQTAQTDICRLHCATQSIDDRDVESLRKDGERNGWDIYDACRHNCMSKSNNASNLTENPPTMPGSGLQHYFRCADQCTQPDSPVELPTPQGHDVALARLAKCGVVHMRGVFETPLITRIQKAWAKFRKESQYGGVKLKDLSNTSNLARLGPGREEVWLPFASPFNDTQLLQAPALLRLVEAYFNTEPDDEAKVTAHVPLEPGYSQQCM